MGLIKFLAKCALQLSGMDLDFFDGDCDFEDDSSFDFADDDDFDDFGDEWDGLGPSESEMESLREQSGAYDDIEAQDEEGISFTGRKNCATRHGCTGMANCDSAYGAPIGR